MAIYLVKHEERGSSKQRRKAGQTSQEESTEEANDDANNLKNFRSWVGLQDERLTEMRAATTTAQGVAAKTTQGEVRKEDKGGQPIRTKIQEK